MKGFKFYSVFFLILLLILELTLFNYRALLSMRYNEIQMPWYNIGEHIQKNKDNTLTVLGDWGYIEALNINHELKNIYIDIENVEAEKHMDKERTVINFSVTDEANKMYFDTPKQDVVSTVEKSKYIHLNLSGKTEKIKIHISEAKNGTYRINQISFNKPVPYEFNLLRVTVLYILLLLAYVLRPTSPVYKIKMDKKSVFQKIILFLFICFNIFTVVGGMKSLNLQKAGGHHAQYIDLANAILDGKFYLDKEPSKTLIEMENPYDYHYRDELMRINGDYFSWDTAYFKGKYYVYFGVTPALLFFIPYNIITNGEPFQNYSAVGVCCVGILFGVYFLLYEIISKHFKNTPYVIYVMLCQFFIYGCGMTFLMRFPDLYGVPIATALMLTIWGLYFWFKARENALFFCPGSICMALVAGARPQFLVGSFLAVPLFSDIVFRQRRLFSKKSIKQTICFILPYIIFASFMMYYNYSRFGSVTDFGANYNLTMNDMTRRGFRLDRIGLGIFSYIFQPAVFSARFPYLNAVIFHTEYMGTTIYEAMTGGVLATQVFTLFNLAVFKAKNTLKEKGLFYLYIYLILFGFVVPVIDAQMAGLLLRYNCDYFWLWMLGGILVALSLIEMSQNFSKVDFKPYIFGAVAVLVTACLAYDFALYFSDIGGGMRNVNPKLFYAVRYIFEFWH